MTDDHGTFYFNYSDQSWSTSSSNLSPIPRSSGSLLTFFFDCLDEAGGTKVTDNTNKFDRTTVMQYTGTSVWWDYTGTVVSGNNAYTFYNSNYNYPQLAIKVNPETNGTYNIRISCKHSGSWFDDFYITLVIKVASMTTIGLNTRTGNTLYTTATYGQSTLSPEIGAVANNGHTLDGWFTSASGGQQVINSSGYLISSVSGYTDSSGNWAYTGSSLTLYAQWTERTYSMSSNFVNCSGSLSKNGGSGSSSVSGVRFASDTVTVNWTAPQQESGYQKNFSYCKVTQGGVTVKSTTSDTGSMSFNFSDTGATMLLTSLTAEVRYTKSVQVTVVSGDTSKGKVAIGTQTYYDTASAWVDVTSGSGTVSIWANGLSGYRFSSWSDGSTDTYRRLTVSQATTLTAYFVVQEHTITVRASTGGTIISPSSGSYTGTAGTTFTVRASLDSSEYEFVNWTSSGGYSTISNPTSLTATVTIGNYSDTVTANFRALYTVAVTTDTSRGYISEPSSGYYVGEAGNTFTITAVPNSDDYTFQSWSVTSGSATIASTSSASTTVTIRGQATITASFQESSGKNCTWWQSGGSSAITSLSTPIGTQVTNLWVQGLKTISPTLYVTSSNSSIVRVDSPGSSGMGPTSVSGSTRYFKYVNISPLAVGSATLTASIEHSSGTVSRNLSVTVTQVYYTITFAASPSGYGTCSRATQTSVPYGTRPQLSSNSIIINGTTTTATPTSSAYEFVRWDNATGEITSARTITAIFSLKTYKITVVAESGGTISPSGPIESVAGGEDKTFTISGNEGYAISDVKIDGTSVGAVSSYTFTNVQSDHTIQATFEQMAFTVTASSNDTSMGTVSPATQSVGYGGTATVTATATENHMFLYWGITRSDGVTISDPAMIFQSPLVFSNIQYGYTVVANFGTGQYTVTLDKNGGTGGTDSVVATLHQPMPTPIVLPTKQGQRFYGYGMNPEYLYYDSQGQSVRVWDIIGNATLHAQWQDAIRITTGVSPSGAGTTTGDGTYAETDIVTLTATAAAGYVFLDWTKDGNTVSTSSTWILPNSYRQTDSTFIARFTSISYTVHFDANGGTGTMADQQFTYGVSQALSANTFTKEGTSFGCWNTSADGSGTNYTDGETVSNLTTVSGATVTLYALWGVRMCTVAFQSNGRYGTVTGDGVQNPSYSVPHGTELTVSGKVITISTTPAKTVVANEVSGASFGGWSGQSSPITTNQTITAIFSGTSESVIVNMVRGRDYVGQTVLDSTGNALEAQLDTSPNYTVPNVTFVNERG